LNFVSNAVRYSHPERRPEVTIEYEMQNEEGILTISDNGLGIDLKKHGAKLFGMYKTFHGHKDAKGIGLFMTKNQIEAMGGRVEVDSTPGVGTTFTIYLNKQQ
jgi:signal transduction histidine kinase